MYIIFWCNAVSRWQFHSYPIMWDRRENLRLKQVEVRPTHEARLLCIQYSSGSALQMWLHFNIQWTRSMGKVDLEVYWGVRGRQPRDGLIRGNRGPLAGRLRLCIRDLRLTECMHYSVWHRSVLLFLKHHSVFKARLKCWSFDRLATALSYLVWPSFLLTPTEKKPLDVNKALSRQQVTHYITNRCLINKTYDSYHKC